MSQPKVYSVIGEKREMVDKKRAEELVLLAKNETDFEEIQLSSKSFGLEAAQVMAELLVKFKKLQRANLNDSIAGRPEEEALKVLEIFCTALKSTPVKEINLSDNALGKKGILACKALLGAKEDLQNLYINNNGLAPEAAELLAELLLFRTPTKLEVFHCFNNLLIDGGAAAFKKILAASPNIQDVRFSATRFTKAGGLSVAQGLLDSGSKLLKHMDLSDNSFGGEAAKVLGTLLKHQPHLEFLSLADAGLVDNDLKYIAEGLTDAKSTKQLHTLIFSGNEISPKGAVFVSQILKHQPKLKIFKIDENELESKGAKILSKVLSTNLDLEEVNFSSNQIGQSGGLALVKALKNSKQLKKFNLNTNTFQNVDQIKKEFPKDQVLSSLSDNEEGEEEEEEEEEGEKEDRDEISGVTKELKELKV